MKYENICDKARVWSVSRGIDGRLREELDQHVFVTIDPMADATVMAAGKNDIDATRAW